KSFSIDHSEFPRNEDGCSDFFDVLSQLLGSFLDGITGFKDNSFFTRLFDAVIKIHPTVGNVAFALANLTNTIGNVFLLPAGQVFFFKDAASDPEANLSLQLTYKSQN